MPKDCSNHPLTKQELLEALHDVMNNILLPGIERIFDRAFDKAEERCRPCLNITYKDLKISRTG